MGEAIEINIGGTLTINDKKYRCEEAEKMRHRREGDILIPGEVKRMRG